VPALQNFGRLLYKERKYKECISVFDRVLAKDVTDVDAIRFQAGCYHALNETSMAIQKFLEVHRLDTDDSETIMTLARLYKNSWEYSKAIPFYQKLMSIEDILQKGHKHMPYDYDIASRLGDMLFVNKDYSQAVSIYRKALLINPQSEDVPVCLAKIYSLKKNFSEAEKILKDLLKRQPSNIKAYEHLAPVYLAQNKLNKAAACYKEIVMLKDRPLEEYLLLGSILLYLNKPKEAIDFYEKSLEIDSNDIRSYNGLGAAYSILSRWDQAIGSYKKALILNAKDEEAKQGLLYALKRDIKGIRANIDALSGASPPARRRGDTGVFTQD
jgi:tetratricopeptide (TPR) repeat protein